jgi:hypothetical protein
MSGLQSGTQDASGWLFSAFPGFDCLNTLFHTSSTGDRSMAPVVVTSETGTMAQGHGEESPGYSGPDVARVPSRRSLRPTDRKGGDSGEPFIQSEASVRGNATYRRVSLRRMPV